MYLTTYVRDPLIADKPRPAMIVCPGGGYGFCSPSEGEPVAERFLSMGYHVFVLQYTVRGGTSFPKTEVNQHDTTWPQPLLDLAAAILTVKDHAAAWNVDPEQIAICGFSAGGHLAGMYATCWNTSLLQKQFERPESDFRIKAALLIYAITDWKAMHDHYAATGKNANMELYDEKLLGIEKPTDEDYDAISPTHLVSPETVPVFLCHAQDDETVPVENSLRFAEALKRNGVPFELHIFENGTHGFIFGDYNSSMLESEIRPDVEAWPEAAHRWLAKRLSIRLSAVAPWKIYKENH